jgi:tetratricopeptide (TPR) repeat protein
MDSDSWYKAGNEKMMKGNNEEAITDYDKAIEINHTHIGALNNKGIALSRLKRYEVAISCYDKAIEINSNHANAWYNKAKAFRDLAQ